MSDNKSKGKNDIILIIAALFLALVIWLIFSFTKKEGEYAVVIRDGLEVARYPLSEEREIRLENGRGGYNILVIKDGKADIIEASCPDKICVHERPISMTGETLTCLPNKTVVKVESSDQNKQDEIDFMS